MTRQQKEVEDLKESAYNAGFKDGENSLPMYTTWPKGVMFTRYKEGHDDGLKSKGEKASAAH
jgi:hypothetical protein